MRRNFEGIVASLMLAGIDFAFALGMFTPNRGAFRAALEERGLLGEWSIMFGAAGVLLLVGLVRPPWREHSLGINLCALASTYVVLLIFGRDILLSPFGNTVLVCFFATAALIWLDMRERGHASGGKERRGQRARDTREVA
jgi:hypothetical protein